MRNHTLSWVYEPGSKSARNIRNVKLIKDEGANIRLKLDNQIIEALKHFESTVLKVNEAKKRIYRIALENGLKAIPSATNFVAIDCCAGKDHAFKIMNGLIERGIFVRMPFVSPQDRCVRVSVGKKRDLDRFEKALPTALARASK